MVRRLPPDFSGIPSVVVIGVPDKNALFRVIKKLETNHIDHQVFYEPDFNMGLSAVATVPLAQEQRRCLSNYRLWREENTNVVDQFRKTETANVIDVPI